MASWRWLKENVVAGVASAAAIGAIVVSCHANQKSDTANDLAAQANAIAVEASYNQDLGAFNQALEDYRVALFALAARANSLSSRNPPGERTYTKQGDGQLSDLLEKIPPTASRLNVALRAIGPRLKDKHADIFGCADLIAFQASNLTGLAAQSSGSEVSWDGLNGVVSMNASSAPDGAKENNADAQFAIANKAAQDIGAAISSIRLSIEPQPVECNNLSTR